MNEVAVLGSRSDLNPTGTSGPAGSVVVDPGQLSRSDRYRVEALAKGVSTSVVRAYDGLIAVGFVDDRPTWETWLPEVRGYLVVARPARSEVGRQIEAIQRITGLSDGQLAQAFPGRPARETLNRWRNRPEPNLRPENLYRLGILHALARQFERADIDARTWLHQPLVGHTESPYDLICNGQLGDVRRAVDAVAAGLVSPTAPMTRPIATRDWDITDEADAQDDDASEWIWQEPDEDGDE